jgi:hypothetical protein
MAASLVLLAGSAEAVNGPGALFVAGATSTPTHYNIPIGVPTAAEIRGVGSEVGSPLPATISVIIKSSSFGNATVTANRIGSTNNYAFTYTPPAIGSGSQFDACETTIVAYVSNAQNTSNDWIDDAVLNGSGTAAAGFRFVDAQGVLIPCPVVGVEPATWSVAKQLYQ